jgi:phosphoribosylaminoimidazole-succinocarboxamide synthase
MANLRTDNLLYSGKTKDVYKLDDGNYLLMFKDDVTGEGGVFDPGANKVGLTIEGAGRSGLRLSTYFFELFNKKGITTHFISSDIDNNTMTVLPAKLFGKGVEVIVRYRAVGSFYRRYALYVEEGREIGPYVEFTLKDDLRDDPLITEDALEILNIMTKEESIKIKSMAVEIAEIVKNELEKKGIELYDIKFEFGRITEDNHIGLIDEVSGGNMRAYKDGVYIEPLTLEKIMLNN